MADQEKKQTLITADVEVTGTIKSTGSVQIDGKLEGDLNCQGDATIGESANIKGNINVSSVSVFGQVNGNITAKDRIELKPTARVIGDIKSKRLKVEDGVSFVGKSEVNPSGAPIEKSVKESEPAASADDAKEDEAADAEPERKSGKSEKRSIFR
ncbi:MAG: polymer-forming cytoskeletal protein [Kiritimatiellae bacterium]|nr:polymer-forming cytoskeletal protein [Kiritimatiellia bacterium]